ncbi:MAG: PAS domain-containing sensor histidine kinase [Planctomycetota bacterium]
MSHILETVCSPVVREIAGLGLSCGATALLLARGTRGGPSRLLLAGLATLALSHLTGVLALVAGLIDPESSLALVTLVGLRVFVAFPLLLFGAVTGMADAIGGRIVQAENPAVSEADLGQLRDEVDKKQELLEQSRHHIGEQAAEANRLGDKLRETLDLLLTSEEKFRTLFERANDGFLVLDLERLTISQANPRMESLAGYGPGELTGRHLTDLCDEDARAMEPDRLRELLTRGRLGSLEMVGRDGKPLAVEMSFALVNVGGAPVLMGVAGDLSETMRLKEELELKNRILKEGEAELRKANERLSGDAEKMRRMNDQLRELQAAKDNFLSSVSHELRTPLTSIRSFSEILLSNEDASAEEKREFVTIINAEAERLTRLVNDVLDLAKIEAGEMRIQCAPFDLNLLAREVVRSLAPMAQEKSIRVESRLPADLPPVNGDRDRLHQVLTNLLSNALKYSPSDTVVVLDADRNDEGMVEVRLEDQGPGIPKEELLRIFEKYSQVGDTLPAQPPEKLPHKQGGTGLGLAICREIITLHGGRVWVRSATGKGASFFFTVPVATEAEEEAPTRMSIADKVRAAAEMARRGEVSDLDLDLDFLVSPGSSTPADGEPDATPRPEAAMATPTELPSWPRVGDATPPRRDVPPIVE